MPGERRELVAIEDDSLLEVGKEGILEKVPADF